jgi:uncharacterized protein
MKDFRGAFALSLAIVAVALIASLTYFNRGRADDRISVTGLGSADFESDLIVWTASFENSDTNLERAYAKLKTSRDIVLAYLAGEKVLNNEAAFGSVSIDRMTNRIYNGNGEVTGEAFAGYSLSQEIKLSSHDVDKVERISRNITELINRGVEIHSSQPEYYYTKLADLKLSLIAKATEDARLRALQVAKNAGAHIGKLRYSSIGVFQITERNASGETSWEGSFDTDSRLKTATVTVKVQYQLK